MALSLKDPETERLARALARRRGLKLTTVIRQSLRHEAEREAADTGFAEQRFDIAVRRAQELVRPAAGPHWSDDEVLGYDDKGVPAQR